MHILYPADVFLEGRQGQLSTINSTVHWTAPPRPPPLPPFSPFSLRYRRHNRRATLGRIAGEVSSKEPGNIQVGLGYHDCLRCSQCPILLPSRVRMRIG